MKTIYGDFFEESAFDSDVLQLIADLGLVLKASPSYLYWLSVIANSQYYKYHLCDRYKTFLKSEDLRRKRLARDIYRYYRKGSRFVSISDQCLCRARTLELFDEKIK